MTDCNEYSKESILQLHCGACSCICNVIKKCEKYIYDDSYVYKLCRNVVSDHVDTKRKWLIIMQKLEDTKTNESRSSKPDGVFNKDYAKFRASKLKVIEIISVNDVKISKRHIVNNYKDIKTEYTVNKIVEANNYDEHIEFICSGGIHYFKTPIAAYYYRDIPENYTGHWIGWYSNGQMRKVIDYKEGREWGNITRWFENGQKEEEGKYIDGFQSGIWTKWYDNGQKYSKGEYIEGRKTKTWIYWYKNGKKESKGYYIYGIREGSWTRWYGNGSLCEKCNYMKGIKQK